MNFIKHFFKRHLCVENIYIDENVERPMPILRCRECGREIGFFYFSATEFKPFLEPKFKKYRQEIARWVNEHTKERNHMGDTSEREWEEMLCDNEQCDESGLQPLGCEEWDDECGEDSESRESIGFGETYEEGLENQGEEEMNVIEVNCKECVNCDMKSNECVIHGKDPTNAVSECAANGFSDYKSKQ